MVVPLKNVARPDDEKAGRKDLTFGTPIPRSMREEYLDSTYYYRWNEKFSRERADSGKFDTIEFLFHSLKKSDIEKTERLDNIKHLRITGFDRGVKLTEENFVRLVNRPGLEGVDIRLHKFDESILKKLGSNQSVKSLVLLSSFEERGVVKFTDSIYRSISEYENLEEISLHGEGLTNDGIQAIAREKKLKFVNLGPARGNTQITASVFDSLDKKSLRYLHIHLDKTVEHDFSSLSSFINLESLYVSGAEVNCSFFEAVSALRKLEKLSINMPKNTNSKLEPLVSLPALQNLRLRCDVNAFRIPPSKFLSKSKSLSRLVILGIQATNDSLEYFEGHPKIEILQFSRFDVNKKSVNIVKRIPTLRRLYFRTEDTLENRNACANLSEIFRHRDSFNEAD